MQKMMPTRGTILMVALGLGVLMGWLSSAEAVITIKVAEVQNGVAVVQGGKAPANAPISWEGTPVSQANNGGNFAFQGIVPADCVGRLEDGVPADAIDVALANCEPVSGAPAPVPQTGQTTSYAPGDDGAIHAGVAWPTTRFTDNLDGTVTDNLTGLIWLKDSGCETIFAGDWAATLSNANSLANGQCGLTDGSVPGQWRIPNIKELLSLIDYGFAGPALSNAAGTGQCTATDCAFSGVQGAAMDRWTSTTAVNPDFAWIVHLGGGLARPVSKALGLPAWPVRGGD